MPTADLGEADLAEWRNRVLAEREQRLELRELRLARQMRALELHEDYVDILEPSPSDQELGALVEIDRKLIALIEDESQLAFERILNNRYAAPDGVDTVLILADLRAFVEQVAQLYRPGAAHPLFETEIELIAKSLSSAALHLLVVVEDLPINLQSYNVAKTYRLIRRAVAYYGTYKAFRPYVEHGLNALQAARLALGVNPAAIGAAWVAGKLTTYGARTVGEKLLHRRALQLLTDFIRVIGFEAAMMYGGDFRHRDSNWVLGALLVNLEVARGDDLSGREAALGYLCGLALRHEFDRIRLLNHMAKRKAVAMERVRARVVMTRVEREDAAAILASHCVETGVDFGNDRVIRWRETSESLLGTGIDMAAESRSSRARGVRSRIRRWSGRRSGSSNADGR